jgi:hypothetical protein
LYATNMMNEEILLLAEGGLLQKESTRVEEIV